MLYTTKAYICILFGVQEFSTKLRGKYKKINTTENIELENKIDASHATPLTWKKKEMVDVNELYLSRRVEVREIARAWSLSNYIVWVKLRCQVSEFDLVVLINWKFCNKLKKLKLRFKKLI